VGKTTGTAAGVSFAMAVPLGRSKLSLPTTSCGDGANEGSSLAARRVAVLIFDSTNSTQYISIHPTQKTSFAI